MDYQRDIIVAAPFAETVDRVRAALALQGFGILTEIDVQATMLAKRGVDMEPYVILGACNPDLALRALDIDRAIGVLLPCNVVVSAEREGTRVRVFDPQIMAPLTGRDEFKPIANEASGRLQAALDDIAGQHNGPDSDAR